MDPINQSVPAPAAPVLQTPPFNNPTTPLPSATLSTALPLTPAGDPIAPPTPSVPPTPAAPTPAPVVPASVPPAPEVVIPPAQGIVSQEQLDELLAAVRQGEKRKLYETMEAQKAQIEQQRARIKALEQATQPAASAAGTPSPAPAPVPAPAAPADPTGTLGPQTSPPVATPDAFVELINEVVGLKGRLDASEAARTQAEQAQANQQFQAHREALVSQARADAAQAGEGLIEELITGSTEQEVAASIQAARDAWRKYHTAGVRSSLPTGTLQAPPTPTPGVLHIEGLGEIRGALTPEQQRAIQLMPMDQWSKISEQVRAAVSQAEGRTSGPPVTLGQPRGLHFPGR